MVTELAFALSSFSRFLSVNNSDDVSRIVFRFSTINRANLRFVSSCGSR
jgi:hypothetical protein